MVYYMYGLIDSLYAYNPVSGKLKADHLDIGARLGLQMMDVDKDDRQEDGLAYLDTINTVNNLLVDGDKIYVQYTCNDEHNNIACFDLDSKSLIFNINILDLVPKSESIITITNSIMYTIKNKNFIKKYKL